MVVVLNFSASFTLKIFLFADRQIENIIMKTKSESKVKKNLKLKRLTKSGESSLKKAVKNVTEILKVRNHMLT